MPHGAGHAGGGGGGFHGGGFHGGYHHHHYGRGRHRGGPFNGLIWLVIAFVVSVIVTLSLSLALGTEPHSIRSSEVYALTDNRLISYRGDFCVNLRATSTQGPKDLQTSATLSFLHSRPPLTGRETFNLSESIDLNSNTNFNSWNLYLNDNSNASIKVCYPESSTDYSVTFYIIKSTENFDKWVEEPSRSQHTVMSLSLKEKCTSISYRVAGDEVYYFVFYLSGRRSTSLDIDFDFNRTLYEVSSDMVVKNCSFPLDGRSQCTLDAPMTPGYTGFLSLNSELPVDFNDGAGISISCTPRGWLYAVIVLVVLFVSACLLFAFVAVCLTMIKAGMKKQSANTTPTTVGPSTVATESDFIKNEPPPYPTAVQYGTGPSAPPPPYKENSF